MSKETKTAEEFTPEEVQSALIVRKQINESDLIELKSMFMAGEICCYEEQVKPISEQLTQQQEVNAELEEKIEDLQIMSEAKDMALAELKKQNAELVAFLKKLHNIEDPIWRLKLFDVDRIKREISELINTPPKN